MFKKLRLADNTLGTNSSNSRVSGQACCACVHTRHKSEPKNNQPTKTFKKISRRLKKKLTSVGKPAFSFQRKAYTLRTQSCETTWRLTHEQAKVLIWEHESSILQRTSAISQVTVTGKFHQVGLHMLASNSYFSPSFPSLKGG